MVEKTITENRMTRSVEHNASIEPPRCPLWRSIREVEAGLGGERHTVRTRTENRDAVRRSIFTVIPKKVSG